MLSKYKTCRIQYRLNKIESAHAALQGACCPQEPCAATAGYCTGKPSFCQGCITFTMNFPDSHCFSAQQASNGL